MDRRALLLLDFQEGVCRPGGEIASRTGLAAHLKQRGGLGRLEQCLARARATDDLILHVGVGFDNHYLARTNRSDRFDTFEANRAMIIGAAETSHVAEARPIEGEPVFWKASVDPFATTNLEAVLRAERARPVLVAGVATNGVVESAVRYMGDRGYDVIVLEDLCASFDEDAHRFAIERILPLFARISSSVEAYPMEEGSTQETV
jgi:nicotinamidase-related amidase